MKKYLYFIASITFLSSCKLAEDPNSLVTPSIKNVSQTNLHFGDQITITGENFDEIKSNNQVHLSGVEATIVNASKTTLTVLVPEVKVKRTTITVKNKNGEANSDTIRYTPDVFLAELERLPNSIFRLWKNGVPSVILQGDSFTFPGLYINGNDIYIMTGEGTFIPPSTYRKSAKLLKNGKEIYSFNPPYSVSIREVLVSNGDLYFTTFTSAQELPKNNLNVYKNGTIIHSITLPDGYPTDLLVVNNDVYVSATRYYNDDYLWKNGIPMRLEGTTNVLSTGISSMKYQNGNLYMLGGVTTDPNNRVRNLVLWKNGLPTEIEKTVVASSVVQLDVNDVYVSATIDSISGFRTKFWKNGIAKGSYRDSPESTTFTVFDGDVYSTNQDTYSPFANYMFNFKQIVVREPSANSFSLISQIIVR
ncbi:IPT/TIG domain-containing protein [Flectobacillus roseus]|uniref:IPT/TIG domain-containing protein n=1 Tax=Flectobacillus roseus TaxID=502259 RepID=A0ABT6Y801_9BACT|nr:IPT/TIG domain-containing protein [Flectobacillus roseus]MDI9859656.1 IPT/TIG domain-containing protein [Flectobacillus roseus]